MIVKKLYLSVVSKVIVLGCILFVAFNILLASGKPEFYYMNMHAGVVSGYCVYAHNNWRMSDMIYCSEDMSKVLLLTLALNTQIQQKTLPTPPEIIQKKEPTGII